MISFWVSGIPATKGSWRAYRNKRSGKSVLVPMNAKEKPWREHVQWVARTTMAALREQPLTGPASVRVVFYLPKPKKPFNPWPVGDVDKLARSLLDALSGIVYVDDKQVVTLTASKAWADSGGPNHNGDGPGALVEIA